LNTKEGKTILGVRVFNIKWKNDLIIASVLIFTAFFVWVASRAVDKSSESTLRGYGGKLSQKLRYTLERMNSDLKNAKLIITLQSDRVSFIDKNERLKEYSYAYNALWCDDYPVVSDVRSFYFEYRDKCGNLLTQNNRNLSSVAMVGYTIRFGENGKEIFSNSKVQISSKTINNSLKIKKYPSVARLSF
jgi:hypothetical protein